MLIGTLYDDIERSVLKKENLWHSNIHALVFGGSFFLLYELGGNRDMNDFIGGMAGLGTGLLMNHFLNTSQNRIRTQAQIDTQKGNYKVLFTIDR